MKRQISAFGLQGSGSTFDVRRSTFIRFVVLVLLVVLVLDTRADTFTLRDGRTFEGQLRAVEGATLVIQKESGILRYKFHEFDAATQAALRERVLTAGGSVETTAVESAESPAPPAAPAASAAPTASAPAPAGPAAPVSLPTGEDAPAPEHGRAAVQLAFALVIGGATVMIAAWVWLVVVAFMESIVWGVVVLLFNGLGALAFTVVHWRRARLPFLVYLAGLALLAAPLLLLP